MPRKANSWPLSSSGQRCRTRCASSTSCATPPSRPKIADKAVKTAMRKRLQPKVRALRKQIKKLLATATPEEARQLAVLDEYASGVLTALNSDGLQPFKYATLEASQMLDEIEASLEQLDKKWV